MKADFHEIELIFITPYLDKNYSKLEFAKYHYDDVIKEMKAQDPDSPVSWYFLRELCKKGRITTLKYGNSWLINVDELYAFFQGGGERK